MELHGRYPQILDDAVVGSEAGILKADADRMPNDIIQGEWLRAKAAVGIWPAQSDGDDVLVCL